MPDTESWGLLPTFSVCPLPAVIPEDLLVATSAHQQSIGIDLPPRSVDTVKSGATQASPSSGKNQPKPSTIPTHTKSIISPILWSPIELSPELGGRESSLSPLMPASGFSRGGCCGGGGGGGVGVGRRAASFIFSSQTEMLWYLPPSTSTWPCSMHFPRSEPV